MLKIITDSASDMPQYIVERFNLHVIPTPVVIDGMDYLDGATIHTKEFYEILDDVSRDIKTYHINPAMFEEAFRPYAEHNDSVIYLFPPESQAPLMPLTSQSRISLRTIRISI